MSRFRLLSISSLLLVLSQPLLSAQAPKELPGIADALTAEELRVLHSEYQQLRRERLEARREALKRAAKAAPEERSKILAEAEGAQAEKLKRLREIGPKVQEAEKARQAAKAAERAAGAGKGKSQ